MKKQQCTSCKKMFASEELLSFTEKGKKYCPTCYNSELNRKKLMDYIKGFYTNGAKIPTLVCVRISQLHNKDKLEYFQILYTLKYMVEIEKMNYSKELFLNLSFYTWRAMEFYGKLFELQRAKTYKDISPVEVTVEKHIHKANTRKIKISKIDEL